MSERYEETLRREFSERVNRLRSQGLVDFKLKLSVNDDSTTQGVVAVLNNALRLREEGKARPISNDLL